MVFSRSRAAVLVTAVAALTAMTVVHATAAPAGQVAAGAADVTFTPAACPSTASYPPGADVDCGTLTVPVDRTRPGSGSTTVPVAVLHPVNGQPLADPVLYLSGGPGDPGRTNVDNFYDNQFVKNRDVIIVDQRGTGDSRPALRCPQVPEAAAVALTQADPATEEEGLFRQAFARCRSDLVRAGADLNAYDTPATTRDLIDLRKALGIQRWNVMGFSYGGRAAVDLARTDTAATRSVVLKRPLAPFVDNRYSTRDRSIDQTFAQLFAGCEASTTCRTAYPNLRQTFDQMVASYNARPFTGRATLNGADRELRITGDDLLAVVWLASYDTVALSSLPAIIAQLAARTDAAEALIPQSLSQGFANSSSLNHGVQTGVDCADLQRLGAEPMAAALRARSTFGSAYLNGGFRPCDKWNVQPVPAAFNQVSRSPVPYLVSTGQYDPIIVPADADRLAAQLGPTAFRVRFPGTAHFSSSTEQDDSCEVRVQQAFLDSPTTRPDTSCTATMPQPQWVTSG